METITEPRHRSNRTDADIFPRPVLAEHVAFIPYIPQTEDQYMQTQVYCDRYEREPGGRRCRGIYAVRR